MGEVITGYGEEAGICGHDGTDWIKVLVDDLGKLQIEIATSALPDGAATSANQTTMITALELIDDLRGALDSVGTDELDVNVEASVLPTDAATQTTLASVLSELQSLLTELQLKADLTETQPVSAASLPLPSGAATSANQTTMITALELIDDLQGALGSVDTDDLQVDVKTMPTTTIQAAGGDKPYSFEAIQAEGKADGNLSAGVNTLDGTAVPTGKVWRITQLAIRYDGTVPTYVYIQAYGLAGYMFLLRQDAPASTRWYYATVDVWMEAGDYIQGGVAGATAGDDLYVRYAGLQMDAP